MIRKLLQSLQRIETMYDLKSITEEQYAMMELMNDHDNAVRLWWMRMFKGEWVDVIMHNTSSLRIKNKGHVWPGDKGHAS